MFYFFKFSDSEINPYHEIESEDLSKFGSEIPYEIKKTNNSNNKVYKITYPSGTIGFSKQGTAAYKEVLAYQLGVALNINNDESDDGKLLMPTAMRIYQNGKFIGSTMKQAYGCVGLGNSIEEYSGFKNAFEMFLFDLIIGNEDRHNDNMSIDLLNKKIHAIDHSEAFDYYTIEKDGVQAYIEYHSPHLNLPDSTKIPASIKNSLNNTSNEEFERILDKVLFHPEILKTQTAFIPDYEKPFMRGPLNTRKYMIQVIDKIRNSETLGELKK